LKNYEIKNWNSFKRKMEELGCQEVGSSIVPYQAHKYAKRGPRQTAFLKIIDKRVNVSYVFKKKETKIKRVDKS